MVRFSNNLIGILNILTLLLSIPIIGGGIWLSNRGSTDCEKFLQKPVIALGFFILLVSIAGLVGACCKNSLLLWIYLAVMFILIVLLFCFTIFAFVVTNKGVGQVVGNRGYKEYKLGDYSHWLQKRVNKASNWKKIRSCVYDAKICQNLGKDDAGILENDFYNKHLTPIQSGCCKPPSVCNFAFVNATVWNGNPNGTTDSDCYSWSNNQDQLCYDCKSCKAGVLANLKNDWRKIAILNIIMLIFLIIVYTVGCCAFRNNRTDNGVFGYKAGA
ncbi:tetraspanin-8 [Cryptomeria japonica]|uniref:tetraspanin-8 n=1 Tax=Cryptomeria japonica TaxID=3369 RepID=UPI0025ABFF90|nr:tetraspanin-8 [Cryptomeria japonica]